MVWPPGLHPPGAPPYEELLGLPFFSLSVTALFETEAHRLFPPGWEILGWLAAVTSLAIGNAGGWFFLKIRERIRLRSQLLVSSLLPNSQLDEGLGFCDEQLRKDFMEDTKPIRMGHEIYSALFGIAWPLRDLSLWYGGKLTLLPGWVWASTTGAVVAAHTAGCLIKDPSPKIADALTALRAGAHGVAMAYSMTWRLPETDSLCFLIFIAIISMVGTLSWLPLGASEPWVPQAGLACCAFVGFCASCSMHWRGGMAWADCFKPHSPSHSLFVPIFAMPLFVGVCMSCALRMWVQSLLVKSFAIKRAAQ